VIAGNLRGVGGADRLEKALNKGISAIEVDVRAAVCIGRSFNAISSFVIAALISGCSPIFSCKAFKIC
jgi:hypothetical protein